MVIINVEPDSTTKKEAFRENTRWKVFRHARILPKTEIMTCKRPYPFCSPQTSHLAIFMIFYWKPHTEKEGEKYTFAWWTVTKKGKKSVGVVKVHVRRQPIGNLKVVRNKWSTVHNKQKDRVNVYAASYLIITQPYNIIISRFPVLLTSSSESSWNKFLLLILPTCWEGNAMAIYSFNSANYSNRVSESLTRKSNLLPGSIYSLLVVLCFQSYISLCWFCKHW